MVIAFCFTPSFSCSSSNLNAISSTSTASSFPSSSFLCLRLTLPSPPLAVSSSVFRHCRSPPFVFYSSSFATATTDGGGIRIDGGGFYGGGGEDEGGNTGDDNNKNEKAIMVLAEAGRSLKSLPKDLAMAIKDGRIPASMVSRFLELEKSPFFRWLLQFGGFRIEFSTWKHYWR